MTFLNEVHDLATRGVLRVVYPTLATDSGTLRELARFADQQLSYVDAFNLVIARSTPDIDAIFAFDHHMQLAGLPVLPS
jgi:predicted nucleic acid-binding protein